MRARPVKVSATPGAGPTDRSHAEALDAADPLASLRERLSHDPAEPDLIYLDGNSLGRLPVTAPAAVRRVVEDEWGRGLVRSWASGPAWIDEPVRVGDLLATQVLGAEPGEVVVCDSTTVNLYKLAAAAIREQPHRRTVLVERGAFPTDRYVLAGLAEARGLDLMLIEDDPVNGPSLAAVGAALDAAAGGAADESGGAALLCLSAVAYTSGARLDLAAVNALAARHGVRVLWDLSHAAGAVPVDLAATGCELAVGCTYKYLHAGPGAPAFLYVRRDLQTQLQSPIQGWFGQADQFAMGAAYDPAPTILRFTAGTPVIAGIALVEAGAGLVADAGMARVAMKSAALTGLLIALADAWLAPYGCTVATPRDAARRGGHVSITHPQAWQLCQALVADAHVIPDFRAPDLVRLGPAPLGTRFVDVWDALDRMRALLATGAHTAYPKARGRVT